MLLGLIHPDSGEIYISGKKFNNGSRRLLNNIGAIIERPDMYGYLSATDNLKIIAALSHTPISAKRIAEVIAQVGLMGRENDKVKTYSMGMKQRLGIALALVHNPDLIILDEPTNGLDPMGIVDMRHLILTLSREYNKTILISSHLLHEIEQIATKMLIIHKGKMLKQGMVAELINPEDTLIAVEHLPHSGILSLLSNTQWAKHIDKHEDTKIIFKMNPAHTPELTQTLVNYGLPITQIVTKHSLEDYFISLTHAATA